MTVINPYLIHNDTPQVYLNSLQFKLDSYGPLDFILFLVKSQVI